MLIICPCCQNSFKLEVPAERKKMELKLAIYIMQAVCLKFGVSEKELTSKKRDARIAKARHCAAFLIYKHCGYTQKTIGRLLNRDHTTVIHALKRCYAAYATLSDLYEPLKDLALEIEGILEGKPPVNNLQAA